MFLLTTCTFFIYLSNISYAQPPENLQKLYQFKGLWNVEAALTYIGEPTITGKGYQYCNIVAKGWGLQCVSRLESEEADIIYDEGVMIGHDAASDLINWSVFNSFGEALTLTGKFTEPDTLKLEKIEELEGGILKTDTVICHFEDENTLTLVNDIAVDGEIVTQYRVRMVKQGNYGGESGKKNK